MSALYDHGCTACRLHKAATTVCVEASGPAASHGMIVGEAPGRLEDANGIPFIGRAGTKLDDALAAASCSRSEIVVTNSVKCRPPMNRTPYTSEIDMCVSLYLTREIESVRPRVILACGNAACEALLGYSGITELRGKWDAGRLGDISFQVLPTWHPAALLYGPNKEPEFRDDVQRFVRALRRKPPIRQGEV